MKDNPVVSPRSKSAGVVLAVSAAIGVVVGVVTFIAEGAVDSPVWFGIFHTIAPWAMVPVIAGMALRHRWPLSAAAGLVAQLGLVVGYYAGKHLLTSYPLSITSLVTYSAVAVVAGPVCGAAGAHLRDERSLIRIASLGVVSAPWLIDGVRGFLGVAEAGSNVVAKVAINTCLVAVGLVLSWLISRSKRDWSLSVVIAAGLTGVVILLDQLPL